MPTNVHPVDERLPMGRLTALGLLADDPLRLRATADGRRLLDGVTTELATANLA